MKNKIYQTPTIEIIEVGIEQGFGASADGIGFSIKNSDELGNVNGIEDVWAN